MRVEYALEELLNVDIRSTFSKPSTEKKYIQVSFWNWNRATTTQYKFRSQSTQATYTKLIFSFLLLKRTQCFSIMYENFSFLVPCFAVFLPHFHIQFFFPSYTQCLFAKCTGRKGKKMRKSTLAIYIEWLELSFMMSIKAGMRRNQENQEGKNINTYQFFLQIHDSFSYTAAAVVPLLFVIKTLEWKRHGQLITNKWK